jgi:hypothetical protein
VSCFALYFTYKFSGGGTEDGIQALMLARQALKPCPPVLYTLVIFLDRVSCFCLVLASDYDHPISTSQVAVYQPTQLVC